MPKFWSPKTPRSREFNISGRLLPWQLPVAWATARIMRNISFHVSLIGACGRTLRGSDKRLASVRIGSRQFLVTEACVSVTFCGVFPRRESGLLDCRSPYCFPRIPVRL